MTLCTVAKWYILQQKCLCLKKWTGRATYEHDFTTFNPLHLPHPLKLPTPKNSHVWKSHAQQADQGYSKQRSVAIPYVRLYYVVQQNYLNKQLVRSAASVTAGLLVIFITVFDLTLTGYRRLCWALRYNILAMFSHVARTEVLDGTCMNTFIDCNHNIARTPSCCYHMPHIRRTLCSAWCII